MPFLEGPFAGNCYVQPSFQPTGAALDYTFQNQLIKDAVYTSNSNDCNGNPIRLCQVQGGPSGYLPFALPEGSQAAIDRYHDAHPIPKFWPYGGCK